VRYVYHLLERLGWYTSFPFMGSSLFNDWYPSLRPQATDFSLHDGLMANGCLPVRSSIKVHDLSRLLPLMALLNLVDASFMPESASSFFFSRRWGTAEQRLQWVMTEKKGMTSQGLQCNFIFFWRYPCKRQCS
jgi:hypothetical protein